MDNTLLDLQELQYLYKLASRPFVKESLLNLMNKMENTLTKEEVKRILLPSEEIKENIFTNIDIKEMISPNKEVEETSLTEEIKRNLSSEKTEEKISTEEVKEKNEYNQKMISKPQEYFTKITTYACDQTKSFYKIFITHNMQGIQSHPDDKISAIFKETSFKITIKELNNVNYEFAINHLCGTISPKDSCFKKKNNMLVIMLKKESSFEWFHVSKRIEKPVEKLPVVDKTKDKDEIVMDTLEHMYKTGDDETKRLVAKSITENRERKQKLQNK